MSGSELLDLRPLPATDRHARILSAFDALAAGEAFELVSEHYPKPLLLQLIEQRHGMFEWYALELGPSVLRVRLQKRAAGGMRSLSEYLEADHRRLDAELDWLFPELFAQISSALATESLDVARRGLASAADVLSQHDAKEEHIIHPRTDHARGSDAERDRLVERIQRA